jgi:hypothetical protein
MARTESRIGDDLSTSPQNPWLGHFRQQQVASAAQFAVLIDRLGNGLVDRRELASELASEIVNRCRRHLDRRAVAKTAAETIFPLRPIRNQANAHGLQFAQSPHRMRRRHPRLRPERFCQSSRQTARNEQ